MPTCSDALDGDTDTDVTTGGGGGADVVGVVAALRLESGPNTAPAFIVPRNAMTWKL